MELLIDALVLLLGACIAVPLFKRLKLGAILGYLVAGVVVGPHLLGVVQDAEAMLHFSELGVVFFLFLVGLELEPKRLWELRRGVFGLGNAQLLVTGALVAVVLLAFGLSLTAALVAGLGLALSSTAIALQLLAERAQAHTPAGRGGFAILLFQDLAVIPILAAIPLLAGEGGAASGAGGGTFADTALAFAKVIGAVALVVVGGRYVTRPLFSAIARARAHEISVAVALLIVVGAGALMTKVGLSMGMGAFLAGVLLADSEYRHELEANVEPFKGLLLGLFFLSIGMTADVGLFVHKPLVIAAGVGGLLVAKGAVLWGLGRLAGWEWRSRVMVAVAMAEGGEFGFVLFSDAARWHILSAEVASTLVIIVSTSMAATPLAMIVADRILARLAARGPTRDFDSLEDANHPIIIAGFGRYGQIVARILQGKGHNFTALEASAEQVDFLRKYGNKIYYGDASRLDLLRAARADQAKAFVLAIDDMEASVRTAMVVKKNFPTLPIYARARNRAHAYKLMDLGVALVNRETLFSAAKLAEQVLTDLGLDDEDARASVELFVRADEEILRRQHAVHHDEQALIQTARQARAELQAVFEQDAARRAARRAEGAPATRVPTATAEDPDGGSTPSAAS